MGITARKPPAGGGRARTSEVAKVLDELREATEDTTHPAHADLQETDGWIVVAEYGPEEDEKSAYSRASSLRKTYTEEGFEFRSHKEGDEGAFVYARFVGEGDEDEDEDTA